MKTLLILLCLGLFSCMNQKDMTVIQTRTAKTGKIITLQFEKGPHYTLKKKLGVMNLTITPQIAVWVEDKKGHFIDTLYITQAFGKQKWAFVKYDPNVTLRDTCLPYWMNQRLKTGLKPPTKNNPLPDSVTGATPKGNFSLISRLPENSDDLVVYAEFNKSFDVNDAFHAAEKGFTEGTVNGQPSVIYRAEINTNTSGPIEMKLIGYGGEKGSDGKIYTNTALLTTAADIAAKIELNIK